MRDFRKFSKIFQEFGNLRKFGDLRKMEDAGTLVASRLGHAWCSINFEDLQHVGNLRKFGDLRKNGRR